MRLEGSDGERDRPGRIAARLARQVELGLAGLDLSLPQYRVMMLLANQSAGASALADHLAVSRPSITSVVDGLVARDLVVRRADPSDRRRVKHSLTPAGKRLLRAADDSVDRRLEDIASYLDDRAGPELAAAGLRSWGRALDAHRATLRARLVERLGTKT